MRKFVIGDIHGRIEALKEVLINSEFNYNEDKLIILGDIVDGGANTFEVVEELLKIKNKVFVLGNHDQWFQLHIVECWAEPLWLNQGGRATLNSYADNGFRHPKFPLTHIEFFRQAKTYHIEDNNIYVHGGFNPIIPIKKNDDFTILWDRKLIETAVKKNIYFNDVNDKVNNKVFWETVYVGHTSTQFAPGKDTKPVLINNLVMMDTGAGWNGKLTIMEISTKMFWQSKTQKPNI